MALRLARVARRVVGIDTAAKSLALARSLTAPDALAAFIQAEARSLPFGAAAFERVICAQNGICAFGVDQLQLLREALRVTRPGGRVLVSTYAARFWEERLAWFEAQAAAGLIGAVDRAGSGEGTIVCRDGFRAESL